MQSALPNGPLFLRYNVEDLHSIRGLRYQDNKLLMVFTPLIFPVLPNIKDFGNSRLDPFDRLVESFIASKKNAIQVQYWPKKHGAIGRYEEEVRLGKALVVVIVDPTWLKTMPENAQRVFKEATGQSVREILASQIHFAQHIQKLVHEISLEEGKAPKPVVCVTVGAVRDYLRTLEGDPLCRTVICTELDPQKLYWVPSMLFEEYGEQPGFVAELLRSNFYARVGRM